MIVMKKFQSTVAYECRWSELFERIIGDWIVIWEEAEADYQGYAKVLAYKDGRFCYVEWTYGSCSGCDPWEDLPEDEVLEEINKDAMFFDDASVLWKWIGMLLDSKDPKAIEFMNALNALATVKCDPAVN